MNTPNKLTMLRIFLIPVFIFFALSKNIPFNGFLALFIFIIASLTDLLDGHIARSRELITDFGKFLDPLADKMLTSAAFILFVSNGFMTPVAVIIIIAREFMVTSLRLIAAGDGNVIAANIWGKIKTVAQLSAIIAILFFNEEAIRPFVNNIISVNLLNSVLEWTVVAATVISGILYLWSNRKLVNHRK